MKRAKYFIALVLLLAACQPGAATSLESQPQPTEIPSALVTTLATSELPSEIELAREIFGRYSPQAQNSELKSYDSFLWRNQQITLLNYSNMEFSVEAWKKAAQYISSLLDLNLRIEYQPGVTFYPGRKLEKPAIIVLANGSIDNPFSNATAATRSDPDTPYVSYISSGDDAFKSLTTEACQVQVQMSAEVTGTQEEATSWANLGQEIFCNSLAIMMRSSVMGLSYEEYLAYASQTSIGPSGGPSFAVIVFPREYYPGIDDLSEIAWYSN